MARRVVVFIDYENMHRCARYAFGLSNGHFWPWQLGELLVAKRNADPRVPASELHRVKVYRGLPDSRRQPAANAANNAQTAAWLASCPDPTRLTVYRRPLRYPQGWPQGPGTPQEKGVDVALAVELVQTTYQGGLDIGIVCSHDSDLAPALDVAATVTTARAHLEVASWDQLKRMSYSDRSGPWCHRLSRLDFDTVCDATVYP